MNYEREKWCMQLKINYFFLGMGLLAAGFTFALMPEYWYLAFFSDGFRI